MDYPKIVELIPTEKLGPLSDQLINFILTSKNEAKMPNRLANSMLCKMQHGAIKTQSGVAVLLEAANLLEPEKTALALGEMQMANVAEQLKGGM
jgi:hypothetical protein